MLGLGSGEEVDGTPAGLLALSLAESLSERFVLFTPSCGWVIFIFLQLGRTRYFRGSGPFYGMCENNRRHLFIEQLKFSNHKLTNYRMINKLPALIFHLLRD